MVTVTDVSLSLGELVDTGVFYPREAKRFAGWLVLDCDEGPRFGDSMARGYRRLESLLFRTTGLHFSPTDACRRLAGEISDALSLGYVNSPSMAVRLAGHLVISAGAGNRQNAEVFRRDRKLCHELGLVRYVAIFRLESRELAGTL